MKSLIMSALVLCAGVYAGIISDNTAPIPPTFKGHIIGENFVSFMAVIEGSDAHLTACKAALTPKVAHKLKLDFNVCQFLIDCSENKMRFEVPLSNDRFNSSDRAIFEAGTLNRLHFLVRNTPQRAVSYAQVLRDMTSRLGDPTQSLILSDGAGVAIWDRSDVYAKVTELKNYSEYGYAFSEMDVDVTSHGLHVRESNAKAVADSQDTLR